MNNESTQKLLFAISKIVLELATGSRDPQVHKAVYELNKVLNEIDRMK